MSSAAVDLRLAAARRVLAETSQHLGVVLSAPRAPGPSRGAAGTRGPPRSDETRPDTRVSTNPGPRRTTETRNSLPERTATAPTRLVARAGMTLRSASSGSFVCFSIRRAFAGGMLPRTLVKASVASPAATDSS